MKRIAVFVSDELHDAIERLATVERRSRSQLCAGVLEAVLTDGGRLKLEDVGADWGSETPADGPDDVGPGAQPSLSPAPGAGTVSRLMQKRQEGGT